MLYPEPSAARQVIAYVAAVPTAFVVSGTMYYLLAPLRRSNVLARFVARVTIIGLFYMTFAGVMVGIAGPYVFAGPMRGGGWDDSPTTSGDILGLGLAAGALGGILWPAVPGAKGDLDM